MLKQWWKGTTMGILFKINKWVTSSFLQNWLDNIYFKSGCQNKSETLAMNIYLRTYFSLTEKLVRKILVSSEKKSWLSAQNKNTKNMLLKLLLHWELRKLSKEIVRSSPRKRLCVITKPLWVITTNKYLKEAMVWLSAKPEPSLNSSHQMKWRTSTAAPESDTIVSSHHRWLSRPLHSVSHHP